MTTYRLKWRCHQPDGDLLYPDFRNHGLGEDFSGRWQYSPQRDANGVWSGTLWAHSAADAVTCWTTAVVNKHAVILLAVECV